MKDWLQEYKRRREMGRSLRVSVKMRTSTEPFWYEFQGFLPEGRMHAGYVRAALMRAVCDNELCRYVEMPVLLRSIDDKRRFYLDTCEEFRFSGFYPLEFELEERKDGHILRVSVFSHEDMSWIEPMFQDAS